MLTYLTVVTVVIAICALGLGIAVVILLWKLSRRFDEYDAAIADLKLNNAANTKEVGERIAANQSLLRKRIDHLEDEIKKHSSRVDLFKKQLSTELSSGIERLDDRVSSLRDEGDGMPVRLERDHS